MKNRINETIKKEFRVIELLYSVCKGEGQRIELVEETGERLIDSASYLPQGEIMGIQIHIDREKEVLFFSSEGTKLTEKDMEWMFELYSKKNEKMSKVLDRFWEEGREIYVLVPRFEEEKDSKRKMKSYSDTKSYYDYEDFSMSRAEKLFTALQKEGDAYLRFILETGSKAERRGLICISLREEIGLELRARLSSSFPEMVISKVKEGMDLERYTDDYLKITIKPLFSYLTVVKKKNEGKGCDYNREEGNEPLGENKEEVDDSEDGTPIDVLELGIGCYNRLRIAKINTVQQLQKMSDNEINHIRGLGRRRKEELLNCLREYEKMASVTNIEDKGYLTQLENLIGLTEVKQTVRKLVAFAKMKKELEEKGRQLEPLVLNMEFVGNPGTAKTTVARILAGILSEIGLLSDKGIVEVGRSNLVGRYTGQTAYQVRDIFQRAKGRILFIDEAYSLLDDWENSFGDEALNTIVQEMENNRDKTVVIFAGYPEKMESLFKRNPGLRSRVPFRINFPDYSEEEMTEITEKIVKQKGFELSDGARKKIYDICELIKKRKEEGNGRFCRNLAESAILSYAVRLYGGGKECNIEKTYFLTEEDIMIDNVINQKKGDKVAGFCRSEHR